MPGVANRDALASALVDQDRQIYARLRQNPSSLIDSDLLYIIERKVASEVLPLDDDAVRFGSVGPLRLRKAQRRLYTLFSGLEAKNTPIRLALVKARQEGFSTFIEALMFCRSWGRSGYQGMVVAHRDKSTGVIFDIFKRYYEYLPPYLKPQTARSSVNQIKFHDPTLNLFDSSVRVESAESGDAIARAGNVHFAHCSELPRWPNQAQVFLGALEPCVHTSPDSAIIVESTARGSGDFFHQLFSQAIAGSSEYLSFFSPWFESDEYEVFVPDSAIDQVLNDLQPGESSLIEEMLRFYKKEYSVILAPSQVAAKLTWYRRKHQSYVRVGQERLFFEEFPSTWEEAFQASGAVFYSMRDINQAEKSVEKPAWVGFIELDAEGKAVHDKDGALMMRQAPEGDVCVWRFPVKDHEYLAAGDCASGATTGNDPDWSTLYILDRETNELAARIRTRAYIHRFGNAAHALCLMYHTPWMACDVTNGFGDVVNMIFTSHLYPRVYFRRRYNQITRTFTDLLGFRISATTKPHIEEALGIVLSSRRWRIYDTDLLGELRCYVRNFDGTRGAQEGSHDDLLTAAQILARIDQELPRTVRKVDIKFPGLLAYERQKPATAKNEFERTNRDMAEMAIGLEEEWTGYSPEP